MAVASLRVCWSKLSARIRDYIDVVDSYYRPSAEDDTDGSLRIAPVGLVNCGDIRAQRGIVKHGSQDSHKSPYNRHNILGTKYEKQQSAILSNSNGIAKSRESSTGTASRIDRQQFNEERHSHQQQHHRRHQHHHARISDSSGIFSDQRTSSRQASARSTNSSSSQHRHHHNHTHTGTRLSQLGYTKRKTAEGQIYFVDSNGNKEWHDPSVPKELLHAQLDLDMLIGPLSSNWEVRRTTSGKTYFTNHTKLTTQLTDPRLVAYKDVLMTFLRHNVAPTYETIAETPAVSQPESDTTAAAAPVTPASSSGRSATLQQADAFATQRLKQNHAPMPDLISSPTAVACANSCRRQNFQNDHKVRRGSTTSTGNHDASAKRQSAQNLHLVHQHHDVDNIFSGTLDTGRRRRHHHAAEALLRGSHQNLSLNLSAGNSNTLTGPPPSWFKQPTLDSLREEFSQPISSANRSNHNENIPPLAQPPPVPIQRVSSARTEETASCDVSQNFIPNAQPPRNSLGSRCCTRDSFSLQQTISPNDDSFRSIATTADLTFSENNRSNNRKELYDKISILRQELLKQQDLSHPCKVSINRKRIFEESFRTVSQMSPRDLKKRLLIKFKGEEGLDYGGVAREWFYLLSKEILNPAHGLFQYTSDDIYNLQINPDSGIVYREHLTYLNFCGRIIGLAVFHGHFIEGRFTLPFYKMLLNKSITLGDIENVDPELYRSLCWILENDITDVIDTTFLVQHNAFGQLQEYELKENGRNITVTERNKCEYVSLYVNYRCRRGIELQFAALQRGFYEIISPHLLENFDEYELELLIGGLSKINIDDWRLYTKLKNCTVETPLIVWFWNIVRSYDEDKRARLLQFVTGSPRVPIQGFKALQGVNSELRLFTIHMIRNGNTDNLPKSHTCFNRIDLPPYETFDKLYDKLTQAIEETMGFAMQ